MLEERKEGRAREAKLEALAHRLVDERDELSEELSAANAMLSDAMAHMVHMRSREAQLEAMLERLMAEQSAGERSPAVPAPPSSDDRGVFDLTKTKAAIEQAVRDASQLPEAQRRKKLNQLRLKWHPDKHEMLREIAEEVSKMLNQAIEACGGETDEADAAA